MSYSQAQQGDLASQPGHPLASGTPPVEEAVSLGSAVQAQDGDSPMEDQPAGTTGAAPSGTQEPRRGQDSHALVGSGDQSPSGEQLSPTTSTCKDHPGAANVTQQSESPGDNSEPKEKAQKQRQQVGLVASTPGECRGGGWHSATCWLPHCVCRGDITLLPETCSLQQGRKGAAGLLLSLRPVLSHVPPSPSLSLCSVTWTQGLGPLFLSGNG